MRKLAIKTSEEWKSGELYQTRPRVVSDIVHGTRFLDRYQVVGKASPAEAGDLRIGLHGWTDAFTPVEALSQKARNHKYVAFTAALLNLPLRMRHYSDHVLLLALYNEAYAKAHGGLVRMLTGIGTDGKKYEDGATLAHELALGEKSPIIELPNDDDPTGEPIKWRLRLFFHLMSFDWLADGEFGPFAASVAARRPCSNCMWTASCPCAFLARDDPRQAEITHSDQCMGVLPRTHEGVMATVRELRGLKTAAARGRLATATGIFSAHFASEHLLRNVVTDKVVDIMHVYFCGSTRYLFSWLTDELIPRDFSWDELNKRKNQFPFKRSVRVPDLARSKGDKRASTSIHLNAAEMMEFTLASPVIMGPLIKDQADPMWQCWLAMVAICRFVLRNSFIRGEDGARLASPNPPPPLYSPRPPL